MTAMANSVARDRLGDMAGITGLTGWVGIVLNAPDARDLAYFYRDLFGWPLADDEPDWCTIRVPGAPANLAFQTEEIYERPTWPATSGKQQMMLHLDIGSENLPPRSRTLSSSARHYPVINLKRTCASYSTLPVTRSASTSTANRKHPLPQADPLPASLEPSGRRAGVQGGPRSGDRGCGPGVHQR